MKNIARLYFLFCIVLFPYMAYANFTTCKSHKNFTKKEMAGDWILRSNSNGGVGINLGPGIASAILRHVTFNKHGVGKENNGTFIFYLPDGTLDKFEGVSSESIKLDITDSISGAGTITIVDTMAFNGTTVYNFLATRNKQGKVNTLYLILVGTLDTKVIVTGVLIRQEEQ